MAAMAAGQGIQALFFVAVCLCCLQLAEIVVSALSIVDGIPTAPYVLSSSGSFALQRLGRIVVDRRVASSVDRRGSTLIPPSLLQFAKTFSTDLQVVLNISVEVVQSLEHGKNDLFLTVDQDESDNMKYVDAAGRPSSEGYSLSVNASGLLIQGASPLGAWWATRTLLQQAILRNGSVLFGLVVDTPGWATRGMMLDIGRHFYPKDFLLETCAYMSFFKQNTFHLHLSDNLWNNPKYSRSDFLKLYARFRLWSDDASVRGLNTFRNESYTKDEFDEIQAGCAARGVTILPEIEAPGHALVITQWKPELAYGRDFSLLNISHSETIPTMKTIWATFLDWFHCNTVSIGADEYQGPSTDYYRFVNEIASFIGNMSGKYVRTWGMYPPRPSSSRSWRTPIYQNVSIQHWEFFEDDAYFDYILNNYSVVNSNDDFYVVNKYGGYPNTIDVAKTFIGSSSPPGKRGGFWRPNLFDPHNSTRNPPANNQYVLGAIAALWNDPGPNATVYSEAFYAWRQGLPALADKQWGGNLTAAKFTTVFEQLQSRIPGQNLARTVASDGPIIFNYTFRKPSASTSSAATRVTTIFDESPNGYNAQTDCSVTTAGDSAVSPAVRITPNCTLRTPLASKGRDYTLALSLRVAELSNPTNATLLAGRDSALLLTPSLTFFAAGNYFRLEDTELPLQIWLDVSISGKGNQTFATISRSSDGEKKPIKKEFQTKLGLHGDGFRWAEIAIEAPIRTVGGLGSGWTGEIRGFSLSSIAI